MTFKELGLIEPILRALKDSGYTQPTPIQEQSIPQLLEGHDLLGCAQTGTGKTAAFSIPILQQIYQKKRVVGKRRTVRALIITPTRELAIQIGDSFSTYGKYTELRNTVIFGGVKQGNQTDELRRGVDIVVATPGRLLDLIGQGLLSLKEIEYFVLDEADQMLDMGFIHDIKKIIVLLPSPRQSLFFSATMSPTILGLSHKILGEPIKVTIEPEKATTELVEQSVYHVSKQDKRSLLIHLLSNEDNNSTLIFSRTKHGADNIVKVLRKANIHAEAIHGNKSQGARQKALSQFKSGETDVLVATDIAARGIDVSELGLVINFDLPNVPETYVHRIGRTGRAKATGKAISFCDIEERPLLKDIQKLIDKQISVVAEHPYAQANDNFLSKEVDTRRQPTMNGRSNNNQRRWRKH